MFMGGSVAEWLACWTQARKGSNRSRDAVLGRVGRDRDDAAVFECGLRRQ